MNKVLLTGRVTNDKYWEMNTEKANVLKFTLATSEISGESEFIDVVIFQNTALNFKKYVQQGDLVEVVGTLKKNTFLDTNKTKQYRLEVIGNSVVYSAKANKNKKLIKDKNVEQGDEIVLQTENDYQISPDYFEGLLIR